MQYRESAEQKAFVFWFKTQYPKFSFNIMSIPNGQNVGKHAGKILKETGLLKGAPDLFIAVPTVIHSGLFIEMKVKGGKVNSHQELVHEVLRDFCYDVRVCWSCDEAIESTKSYLLPNSFERA